MADQLFFDRVRMRGNPVANAKSLVICGQARFSILTDRLVRLEWSATGEFEDRGTFAFPTRYASEPKYSYKIDGTKLDIETDHFFLHYVDDGKPFSTANLSVEFDLDGQRVKWQPGTINSGNLRGTRRTLDQCAGTASLQEGLLSRDGWSLFDDSGLPVWNIDRRWLEERPETHVQDWYFFAYGHDYKAALSDYVQFGGPIPLIPRYVLGLWWSRFWAYSADELTQLVNDFNDHDIPLDVLVVDMDWHTPFAWTGYTWNRDLFPDPVKFLAEMHRRNLHITLNLHPAEGIQKHEDIYPQFAERLGQDPTLGDPVKFNSADETFIENYFTLLHHPMEDQGVDFWWLDWQQGESTSIKNLDPLPWLNHLHFQDSARRGNRPMLYSRWGGLGNHRYPIGFSGDTYATWDSLRFQPYFTATAANVAYGWWSHDIGGHFGATDPELYVRWVQFGAVGPCLRLHSTKDPLAERRPWAFSPEVYEASKAAIHLRYKLLPYLYSVAHNASQQGLSLCYPMYYDYPDIEDAYLARGQYFLGDQIFAAPIVDPIDPATGLASVDVWIPEGTWTEYTTLEQYTGPQWVRISGDLKRIPMFARPSAIIPLAPPIIRTQEFSGEHLILALYPGLQGSFEYYEDDGTTEAYRNGDYQSTSIRSRLTDDNTLAISFSAVRGKPADQKRTIELHVKVVSEPATVTVNAIQHTDWYYDAASAELVIMLNETNRQMPLDLVIHANEAIYAQRAESATTAPFVHVIDFDTAEDVQQQLGTIVIAPPTNGSAFDVEIEWKLEKGGQVSTVPMTLKACTSRQIVHSPFKDAGSLETFRWSVSVNILWQGQSLHTSYQSPAANPSINQWQTLIYNREDGHNIADLPWQTVTRSGLFNLRQPFGTVLLEQDRQRIIDGEPLEACLKTTLLSESEQEVILCLQSVGDYACHLNAKKLAPGDPIEHVSLEPMFYSWMPPTVTCYRLRLHQGPNELFIKTHPDTAVGWWGIGATVFDEAGQVLTTLNSTLL